jgi:membrane protein DedA with SNARE-associated domain
MELFSLTPDVLVGSLGYGLVFLLLTINGIISFPSSQVIYLVAGVLVAKGNLEFLPLVIAGGIGNAIGNLITYALIYKYGENIIEKFFLVKHSQVKSFQERVTKRGVWLLFVGKLTPSVKVLVPLVAGLAKISPHMAVILFTTTSTLWAAAFVGIGYFFGTQITMTGYSAVMGIIGLIVAIYFYKSYIKTSAK